MITFSNISKFIGGLVAVLVCMISHAQAQTLITTFPSWDGSSYVFPWGNGDTPTYGQTFTVPTNNVLNNFTFSIENSTGDSIGYQPFIYAWNGTTMMGPA